ncbi:MAG: glycosyltransferase, partial [Candidatus Limivicinus sp.]|nr:glycosyltransferase [Candidatus Limivicinus sp.]
ERDNYIFLPNAVDTRRFRLPESVREKYRAELGLTDKLVIGHVGRFQPAKNQSFLLDAFKLVHDRKPDSALLLVGDGDLRARCEEKAAALGLSDSVIFTGNRSDVPELLQAMDVFAFPSVWEGLPVTLIEAQAAGLPCYVSSNVSADADVSPLAEHLPIGDAAIWADKLLNAPPRRDVTEYIVRAGFDARTSAEKMTELYLRLAGEK